MAESLTEEQQRRRRSAIRDLMPTTPFIKGLGIVFERYEPDDVTYLHGGVIASVMDTTGAAAAWSNHDFDKGTSTRARAPRRCR
jgi:acyl-coenzyme A thioesterase PaaI-like protein